MAKINLLPWRETRRIERARRFNVLALGALICSAVLVGSAYAAVAAQLASQRNRNAYLIGEIQGFEQQQSRMKTLKKEEKRLLNRLGVIESLQLSRPLAVHLLDAMAHLAPDDIRVRRIEQQARDLEIRGLAGEAASIPEFMRRISASERFSGLELISIERSGEDAFMQVEFVLRARQAFPGADDDAPPGERE